MPPNYLLSNGMDIYIIQSDLQEQWGLNDLLKVTWTDVFHLVCPGIWTSYVLVTGPTLLTARLPVAPMTVTE